MKKLRSWLAVILPLFIVASVAGASGALRTAYQPQGSGLWHSVNGVEALDAGTLLRTDVAGTPGTGWAPVTLADGGVGWGPVAGADGGVSATSLQGANIAATTPSVYQILASPGGGWQPATVGGDLTSSIAPGNLYVSGMTGWGGIVAEKANTLQWSSALTPTINQQTPSTVGNGATFSITGQTSIGTTSTNGLGGFVAISGGTGGYAAGNVQVFSGALKMFESGWFPGYSTQGTVFNSSGVYGRSVMVQNSAASSSSFNGLSTDGTTTVYIARDGSASQAFTPTSVVADAVTNIALQVGLANVVNVTASQVSASEPILGDGVASPWGVHGEVDFPAVTGTFAVTPAQYAMARIVFQTTGGGTALFPLPATVAKSYGKWVTNLTSTAITIAASSNGSTVTGATISLTGGGNLSGFFWFSPGGVTLLTALH